MRYRSSKSDARYPSSEAGEDFPLYGETSPSPSSGSGPAGMLNVPQRLAKPGRRSGLVNGSVVTGGFTPSLIRFSSNRLLNGLMRHAASVVHVSEIHDRLGDLIVVILAVSTGGHLSGVVVGEVIRPAVTNGTVASTMAGAVLMLIKPSVPALSS